MKLKTVTIFSSVLIGILFSTLTISYLNTSKVLDLQARELSNTEKQISAAKGLKVALLQHNRSVFLFSLNKKNIRLQKLNLYHDHIISFLDDLDILVAANKESKKFQEQIRNKILTYIEKREQFGNTSLSAIEQYNSASKHIDELDLHIDSFVKHNDGRMKSLIAKIDEEKNRADGLALFLLTSGLVTILIILFGIFTMIYKPLLNLSKIINEYKNGNVNVRANNSGLNEIKVVANNFNLMAENLKRQKEDQLSFIASIAHDLRNPLNAISIAIHLLMQDTDVKNIEILKIIHKQTNDLNRLVGDLLDTTRIEAGQLELEFSDTDIVTLLQNAVELFRNSSEIHNFVLKLPKSPVICHCDEVRLSQVINNLITNSIKYSPAGGCITVSMVKEEDRILFSVTDQGMGIEPNELENIFNPFQRTKATKSTIPGIGLGLSASKKIIEGHKGKIEVQSILNQGSTFQVTLPV